MDNFSKYRDDFPILQTKIYDRPLVYLDNAATTQKPQRVIDAVTDYYLSTNSNVHRGLHYLSEKATAAQEAARQVVQGYLNAHSPRQIIFTKGTTDSINLVAFSFGEGFVQPGDEIIVSEMEHHSNFVPWQLLCERKGATLKVIPFDDNGELRMDVYAQNLSEKTRLVAVNYVSNSLGTINPVGEIITKAHEAGAVVMIDGAQSVQHIPTDVQALDCEFFCFSGHKIYGPTGIGVLYGKEEWLDRLPPYQAGGEMIHQVTVEKTTFSELPFKFEAGTPNIAGIIGLGEALSYVSEVGVPDIAEHENELLQYATEKMSAIDGLRIFGTAPLKTSVISFLVDGIHHYDMGTLLDKMGVAVRTGHHCTQPIMDHYHIEGTVRASLALYNNTQDIDTLVDGILKVKQITGQ
jgi:cysteine desulfurase/selenocysteine lyase